MLGETDTWEGVRPCVCVSLFVSIFCGHFLTTRNQHHQQMPHLTHSPKLSLPKDSKGIQASCRLYMPFLSNVSLSRTHPTPPPTLYLASENKSEARFSLGEEKKTVKEIPGIF